MLVRTEENPVETAPESRSVGLAIGDRQLKTRYFLAPLAGYTHLPLRTALRELGGIGLATTDLILAPQLLADSKKIANPA